MNEADFISFSATLNGKLVRLTVSVDDFEIVDRDNIEDYPPELFAEFLKNIEFEDIY